MSDFPAILWVDDKASDLPNKLWVAYLRRKYGLDSVIVDPHDPIASAEKALRENPSIVCVLTDSCGRRDFSHVRRFRELRPDIEIAVLSGQLDLKAEALAVAASANACFKKDEDYGTFLAGALNDEVAAERRFDYELPNLLGDTRYRGKWVAYTRHAMFAHCDDDARLWRECSKKLPKNTFYVGRVLPKPGPSIVNDSWFISKA